MPVDCLITFTALVVSNSYSLKFYQEKNNGSIVLPTLECPFEKLFGTTLCWIHGVSKEIKEAMTAWEKNTCIRFKKRTGERDYIRFINGGKGKYGTSVILTIVVFKDKTDMITCF